MDDMDEQNAIRQLKDGHIGGLEFLVGRYQLVAVRTAYLITGDPGLAEDVVQEAFLRAFRSIRSFDAKRPFGPWFLRSVVNASLKVLKKETRQVQVGDQGEGKDFGDLAARLESVETQAESAETQRQLWEAMQKLSPRQRAVVVPRYFLEMSEKEIAAETGAATGTIKWLLNAARARLRSLLVERSDE